MRRLFYSFKKPAHNDVPIHQEGFLERIPENEISLFNDLSECSGCGACIAICPKQAIGMELIGNFFYPHIDEKKCVHCKQCMSICPFKEENAQNTSGKRNGKIYQETSIDG